MALPEGPFYQIHATIVVAVWMNFFFLMRISLEALIDSTESFNTILLVEFW